MKRLWLPIIIGILICLLSVAPVSAKDQHQIVTQVIEAVPIGETAINGYNGEFSYAQNNASSFSVSHDASVGNYIYFDPYGPYDIQIANNWSTYYEGPPVNVTGYCIKRGMLRFPTSSLADKTILSLDLQLLINANDIYVTDGDPTLVVVDGAFTFAPEEGHESFPYDQSPYTLDAFGDLASATESWAEVLFSEIPTGEWFELSLDSFISELNLTGFTQLGLRLDSDINNSSPTGPNQVGMGGSPRLVVTYEGTTAGRAILNYTPPPAGSILQDDFLFPPQMYTELDTSKIPGGDIVTSILGESDTPPALWWFPFIFLLICIIMLLVYDATQHTGGEGSLLAMCIVGELGLVLFGVMGVTNTSSIIPLFPAFLFPIPAIALILSRRHVGWG
jgi:hypothetical protein